MTVRGVSFPNTGRSYATLVVIVFVCFTRQWIADTRPRGCFVKALLTGRGWHTKPPELSPARNRVTRSGEGRDVLDGNPKDCDEPSLVQ
eukprot:s2920_g4.t1